MAVALDAAGTLLSTTTAGTSISYTNITVGSGSNRGLILVIAFDSSAVTSPSATWDSGGTNQSMTLLGTLAMAGSFAALAFFGLVNPTSGNKTLACSWTTSSQSSACAIAFTGVNQTGGATSFPHWNTANGNSITASVTITSATGNMVVGGFVTPQMLFSAPSNTQLYLDHALADIDSSGNYAPGAATVTLTDTGNAAGTWACAGVDVLAAAGATFIAGSNKPILQAVKRAAYW